MENKIDIVVSMFGNIEVIKNCFETWFPLPENWSLYVYDNKVSEIDGTKQYLKQKQTEHNFQIIDQDKILTHGNAIDVLLKNTTAKWILHLDSDVEILDKKFFKQIEQLTLENNGGLLYGTLERSHFNQNFIKTTTNEFRIYMPRIKTWVCLFDRNFVTNNKLSFAAKKWKILDVLSPKPEETNNFIFADTGWEFYWQSMRMGVFRPIPNEVLFSIKHIGSASLNWNTRNKDVIKKMRDSIIEKANRNSSL